eukprot:gene26285-42719_t
MVDAATAVSAVALSPATSSRLPFALHPLQFRVRGNVFLGCVVGNGGILLFFVLLHHLLDKVVAPAAAPRMGKRPEEVCALLQIPGNFFTAAIFIFQGVMALLLRRRGADAFGTAIGCSGVALLCAGIPCVVWRSALRAVPCADPRCGVATLAGVDARRAAGARV